jgi:hypothetical protein
MDLFISKEKKAMKARMAMRRGIADLKRWERSLEKKRADMIRLGQEAKRQGIRDQYALALSGLKMIMAQIQRAKKMQLQLNLVETMRDLSTISSGFVGMMGKVGKEIEKVTGNVDFMKNQMKFEQGMMSIDDMMGQLESFMDDADPMLSVSQEQQISDSDIEKMFDATASAEGAATPGAKELLEQIKTEMQSN